MLLFPREPVAVAHGRLARDHFINRNFDSIARTAMELFKIPFHRGDRKNGRWCAGGGCSTIQRRRIFESSLNRARFIAKRRNVHFRRQRTVQRRILADRCSLWNSLRRFFACRESSILKYCLVSISRVISTRETHSCCSIPTVLIRWILVDPR